MCLKPINEIRRITTKNNIRNIRITTVEDNYKLEFCTSNNNVSKTIEITTKGNKYNVLILPNNITRIVDLKQLEDMIISLAKESQYTKHTSQEIELIKKKYIKGTRIELVKMNDYLSPIPSGTKGTVEYVDAIGKVYVKWENETSTLPLIVGLDEFEILCPICKKPLKDKSHIVYKVGEIRAFAYSNQIYFGKIVNIDEENHIYKLEEIKTKKIYEVTQEYILLGCG